MKPPFPNLLTFLAGSLVAAPILLAAESATITVEVDRPGHPIPPTLWGIFFEDINHSADGGIYPELVRNLSFEDANQPDHWTLRNLSNGDSEMTIDRRVPLNPLNRQSLRVRLHGEALLVNDGYWGMNLIQDAKYKVRLAARAADGFRGPIEVRLEAAGAEPAMATLEGLSDRWRFFTAELVARTTDPKGRFSIHARGEGTLWLDMVSVMPAQTWKDHGLRPDLCEKLSGLKPAFVRFPGGCWVEGDDLAHSYRWKETIGDTAFRKPLENIWGYRATHGLGYHEYLQMCEDLGAEALFVINCGMSHKENVPLDWMGQLAQDALDAIEYANGPTNSVWGAVRARNGHPAPFNLKYMEIGNENGGPAYADRYALMLHAIKARYPTMNLVANDWGGAPSSAPVEIVDEHYYSSPEFFIQQAGRYDRYDRQGPKVYVGEYAVTQGCGEGNLRAAVGEAAFMTGMERNSDVVVMASYAPLFVNVNHRKWNPDLIGFDSARAYGIPSYYVQQMFAQNRGDVVLPVAVDLANTAPEPRHGRIGLGTWSTQAEYKDLRVTRANETLFTADFSQGASGWNVVRGDWKTQDGAYRQTSTQENVQAHAGDPNWADYTVSVKARKVGGAEGFLLLFNVLDDANFTWWNVGGWGNTQHAIEFSQAGGKGQLGTHVAGSVETGRWYDLRVETHGQNIKCYLDGKLVHDVDYPQIKPLYVAASREQASRDVIVKLVNVSKAPLAIDMRLKGTVRLANEARALVLTHDDPMAENSIDQPTKVAPVEKPVRLAGSSLSHTLPGNSVTILRMKAE